jgi:hypothetical protein
MTTEVKETGDFVVVYAEPGMGKTTLTGQAAKEVGKRGLYLSCVEDGLSTIQKDTSRYDLTGINRYNRTIKRWEGALFVCECEYEEETSLDEAEPLVVKGEVCPNCGEVKYGDMNVSESGFIQVLEDVYKHHEHFDRIIIDSFNMLINNGGDLGKYCLQEDFIKSDEYKSVKSAKAKATAYSNSALIQSMATQINDRMMAAIMGLIEKGVDVYITMHSSLGKDVDGDGEDVKKIGPYLPAVGQTNMTKDIVGRATHVVYGFVDTTVIDTDKGKRVKAYEEPKRMMATQSNGRYMAKFRGNAPSLIEGFEWELLKKYL